MSQGEIVSFLKRHSPQRFTADEINNFLDVGKNTVYANLRKLRPKCGWCGGENVGVERVCRWCNARFKNVVGVCADKCPHRTDARFHSYFYWWPK